MDTKWSLYIKDFAQIKEATIEVNPMMIFVGDNSSGKSYVMTLLWGLISRDYEIFQGVDIYKLDSYDKCAKWVEALYLDYGKEVEEDEELIQQSFVDLFNEALARVKDDFVQGIFNGDVSIGEIKIVDFKRGEESRNLVDIASNIISQMKFYNNINKTSDFNNHVELETIIREEENYKVETRKNIKRLTIEICTYFIFKVLKYPLRDLQHALYFPAARTGFSLTYKTLIAGSLDMAFSSGYGKKKSRNAMSEPALDFLKRWTQLDTSESNDILKDIINYLELELMRGRVIQNDMPVPDVFFIPEGMDKEIPIHLTSSLVTELTPIALFLKYGELPKTIIIEEPEAHLQLSGQVTMSRFLAKILNREYNTWITTHSDTIVQEINNLIKLNSVEDKEKYYEKYGINKDEIIDFNKVGVYEFRNKGNYVEVTPTSGDEEGYEYPQITDTILQHTNLVLELDAEDDDD